jgi:ribokinase
MLQSGLTPVTLMTTLGLLCSSDGWAVEKSMTKTPRIAVVGSANMDLTTFTQQFPKSGETIFGQRFDLGFGGKGANQAVAARLCGAEVFMVARVGSDLFGPATVENFARFGIDVSQVRAVEAVSTGVAPIFVDPAGHNRILVVKGANDCLTPAAVDAAKPMLKTVDWIVLQFEIPLETVNYTIQFARQQGIRSILNPAPAQSIETKTLMGLDYFVPNESEAEAIIGSAVRNLDDAKKCAQKLLSQGIRCVILTLGANGSLLAGADGMEHVPAFPMKTVDTSGAGDAFIGSFAVFLGEGLSEREAVRRANLYAGLSTTRIGTQKSFYTRDQFEAEWKAREPATTSAGITE